MSDNDNVMQPATDEQVKQFLLRRLETANEREKRDFETIDKLVHTIFKLKEIPNMYGDVVKFIEACDQERNDVNVDLYHHLIREEYNEYIDGRFHRNDVEQLDACMDMIWVILGYCYMKGFDVAGAWHEVARSNLEKIDPETGKVIKRGDGKVLKPEGWTSPSLEQFTKK